MVQRRKRRPREVVRQPAGPVGDRCYLCGRQLERDDKVVRIHETTMHRGCYEADIERGR